MSEMEWDISALHYIHNNIDESMMQLGEFLGNCSTLPWNTYGIHIYEEDDHLIFVG